MHRELSGFMRMRGAVILRPDDGIVHAWMNRMLLPDRLGTGADSHSRFPLGISFPAGSGMVAFAAATGVMPMEMPESVLVRFVGERRPGITIRDLVHAIPLFAQRAGLLTLEKKNKVNVFNGRILEFAGLPDLSIQEAFELTDASAERSACAATIELGDSTVRLHLQNGVELLRELIDAGYEHQPALMRRLAEMEQWLDKPAPLLRASEGARYAAVLEIDLAQVTEPVVCCPNDPDDARFLSDVPEEAIDEVFLGSCMTNAEHFRRASRILRHQGIARSKLWIAPPTRLDKSALHAGGETAVFHGAGARQEKPGCSLCMGNQARVRDGASVVSTSTRNYPNRMGLNARVYLASAEVASLAACFGRLPSAAEYFAAVGATHGQGMHWPLREIPARQSSLPRQL
jgi:aconitate hydratase 2/2-methylisocitrate dehydratase